MNARLPVIDPRMTRHKTDVMRCNSKRDKESRLLANLRSKVHGDALPSGRSDGCLADTAALQAPGQTIIKFGSATGPGDEIISLGTRNLVAGAIFHRP